MTQPTASRAEVLDRLAGADHVKETYVTGGGTVMALNRGSSDGCFYTSLTEETGWVVVGHQRINGATQTFLADLRGLDMEVSL